MSKKHFLVYWILFFSMAINVFAGRRAASHREVVCIRIHSRSQNGQTKTYFLLRAHQDRLKIKNEEGTWAHLDDDTWLNLETGGTYLQPHLAPKTLISHRNICAINHICWLMTPPKTFPLPSLLDPAQKVPDPVELNSGPNQDLSAQTTIPSNENESEGEDLLSGQPNSELNLDSSEQTTFQVDEKYIHPKWRHKVTNTNISPI
jgi:hypothetical protein